jgi:hypothetical protein
VAFLALLIVAVGVGVRMVVTGGYLRPAGQVVEHRSHTRTSEEELVKRFILNNAGEKANQVKFLSWGPHMYKGELQGLLDEAGLDLLARHNAQVADLFKELDAIVRVRYELPGPPAEWNLFDAWNPMTGGGIHDTLFLVVGGKLVVRAGDLTAGLSGDNWKKELRKELSKIFPAVERK